MARSRRRHLAGRSSRRRALGSSLRAIPSWASFERLEQRQVLATDVNVSVGLGITQVDSSVHGSDERIVKQGDGTLVLSAANAHTGGIVVTSGTLVVRNVAALGSGPVEVQAGAKLVLDDRSGTVEATSLVLQEGGLIDVGSSKLSIQTGFTQAMLISAIQSAKGDGSWNGESGIGSSVVRSLLKDGTARTLGWLTWVANDDSSYTVGFAAAGDTNLDGVVDVIDLSNLFASDYLDPSLTATWEAGDFNHDGIIDTLDLSDLMAANLLDSGSYLPPEPPPVPTSLLTTATSLATDSKGDTSAIVGGMIPGIKTHFRVRSYNESPSWWWDDRYRSADTATVAATAIPSTPVAVTARGVTPTQAVISWVPGPGRSTGTVVQRQQAGDPVWSQVGTPVQLQAAGDAAWVEVSTVAPNLLFVIDTGVEPGATYTYRVQSVSDGVSSVAVSPAGSVTMPTEDPPSDSDQDGDGVPDVVELVVGSNPDSSDTDGDGVTDYQEVQQGSNPTVSGSLAPDPVARANPSTWAAELMRDDGIPRSTEVVILPSEITLPAPILVQWYGGPIALGGVSGGAGDVGNEVVSIATRWIIVDLYRAAVSASGKANGGVALTYLSIDVDIDSDNTGGVQRSAWEEKLEEEKYGLGKLIMLANSPSQPLTELVIDVPRPIMTLYGLPANEAGQVGLRFDWNPAGKAGSIRLWNTQVQPAARNPAPLDQGGNLIEPGKFYPLDMFRDDMMVFVEGVEENVGLKTLAGVEREGKPEEYIRGTFIVKGQDVGSDQVKYLVANEDSFFYELNRNPTLRNALASRGVYTFADMPDFCLQPKSPLDLRGLGVPNESIMRLGEGSGIGGFKAMVYQDYITGDRQYVLAFAGTDDTFGQFLDWLLFGADGDWKTNFDQGLGRGTPPQYEAAMKNGDGLSKSDGIPAGHLIVTGHSLGGGLATAAAMAGGFRADTFNAAWLRKETLLEPDGLGGTRERYPGSLVNFAGAAGKINAHYVDWDILTYFQTQFRQLDPTIAPVGLRHELDGPHDFNLTLADPIPLASLYYMSELHKNSSVLYGLLVTEDRLGHITIDLLGYVAYFSS